ncbi:hypothetical protein HDU99_004477 [Rhizoclosmatium hyalinum]|nr:hypothetical protein HDU99_004477 [Rhizoclosmatium hyalinum]
METQPCGPPPPPSTLGKKEAKEAKEAKVPSAHANTGQGLAIAAPNSTSNANSKRPASAPASSPSGPSGPSNASSASSANTGGGASGPDTELDLSHPLPQQQSRSNAPIINTPPKVAHQLIQHGHDFIHQRIHGVSPRKMAKLFPEIDHSTESVVLVYNCALEKDILWQGKLYCTTNYLCFHSVVFGKTERLVLPWRDVISIEKKMTAAVFPNAIKITLLDGKYTFASFLKRDTSYADISAHWKSVRGNPKVMLGVNNSGVRRSDGRLNSLGTENDDHGGPGSNSGNSGEHPQTRRGSDYVQLQQFKGPVKSLGALNGANGGAERRSITHHGGVPAIQQRAMELDVFTSFDLSQPSGVTPPPGMALLYDPKAILGPWRGPSLIVGSVTDSVEQPDSNSGTTRSTGGGTQKSNSTNSAGSGMYGNAGGPNRSIDEESNDGTGGSNNPNNNPDSSNAASAVPRKPAKCTCESHEGLQIVNQVLPHGLRMLVEKLTKEEGSRVLQDAYNACGSDGIVFWRWNVGEDGKRSSRVVEYTARFAGFMNAEPILCKEYQQVLSSNDDCVVMDVKVESAQKFDIGNIHRSISFTNRICLTYEDTQKLRIKVHSHMNDSQGTEGEKVLEKAIFVRNHNYCNALINSLRGVKTTNPSTPPPAAPPIVNGATPDAEPPTKRSSSLPANPAARPDDPPPLFLLTPEFWKSVMDTVVIVPAVTAGKALGILVPLENNSVAGQTAITASSTVAETHHNSKKKKKGNKAGGQHGADATGAAAGTPPSAGTTSTAAGTSSGFSFLRGSSTNTKILGLAMMAVVFGLGLTVLNIVWMAELSDRLERTLDAVRVAREQRLSGGGKQIVLEAGKSVPAAVAESLVEMKVRLLDHSKHLISSLPVSLERSIGSVDDVRVKLKTLKEELLANPLD